MKKLTEILREINDEPEYILIDLDWESLSIDEVFDGILNEGIWKPSKYSGYQYRLDQPSNDTQRMHVHIAKDKHINTKTKQVAWNDDGTRHDRKTFDINFDGMNKAKEIARITLGLKDDTILEHQTTTGKNILLESVQQLSQKSRIYTFIVN